MKKLAVGRRPEGGDVRSAQPSGVVLHVESAVTPLRLPTRARPRRAVRSPVYLSPSHVSVAEGEAIRGILRHLVIWGGGGHGRVVADLVRALGCEVAGFVDVDAGKIGQVVEPGGGMVIVSEAELRRRLLDGRLPGAGGAIIPAIGRNATRAVAMEVIGPHLAPGLVHPAATVSDSARVGAGTVIIAGAVVNSRARIGRGVIVNTSAVVEHDCEVADGAHVSPGAILAGNVTVGARSWIGAGSVVIEGRRVGSDVIVGAGAVVVRDVPDGQTVVGNPARPIQRRTSP